jgi:hypothetical protein
MFNKLSESPFYSMEGKYESVELMLSRSRSDLSDGVESSARTSSAEITCRSFEDGGEGGLPLVGLRRPEGRRPRPVLLKPA